MNSLAKKIDQLIEQKSLLKHPFYQMWSDGKLSKEMLAGYSKEYFQMVKAVPVFVGEIAKFTPQNMFDEIKANQQEESEHIKPWTHFAVSLGVNDVESYVAPQMTTQAVSELSCLMTSLESGAVAMYAFEKEIPKISHTKLDGLAKFYNITEDSATEYFRLHEEADVRHAATWEKVLDRIPEDRHAEFLAIAEKSLDAQNHLLDSCYQNYCTSL